MDQIKPASVTLIFPVAHINSPASMFEQVLLTVDTASKSRLLAHSINYSAITRETFLNYDRNLHSLANSATR